MTFTSINLRTISDDVSPLSIRTMSGSPLIHIQLDGKIGYALGRLDKDEMVLSFKVNGGLLLFVWMGQYSTTIFNLTPADLEKHFTK